MRPMTKVIEIPQYEDDDSGADLEGPKSLHNDSSRVSIKMGSTRVILQDMGSGGQAHSASRLPPINENETQNKVETIRALNSVRGIISPLATPHGTESKKASEFQDEVIHVVSDPDLHRAYQKDEKIERREKRKIGADDKNRNPYEHLDADIVLQTISQADNENHFDFYSLSRDGGPTRLAENPRIEPGISEHVNLSRLETQGVQPTQVAEISTQTNAAQEASTQTIKRRVKSSPSKKSARSRDSSKSPDPRKSKHAPKPYMQ